MSKNKPSTAEKNKILEHVLMISQKLVSESRSSKISVKLRTLLRYAYISYQRQTFDLSTIRGLVPRLRPPSSLANQYFYRDIETLLKKRFNVDIHYKRNFRYVTFYKT